MLVPLRPSNEAIRGRSAPTLEYPSYPPVQYSLDLLTPWHSDSFRVLVR